MEKASASFFVFGIRKNAEVIFYDIAEDLIGEIQLEITGLDKQHEQIIIWGKMYPYFGTDDYGKFKLTISGNNKRYEFQCHGQGH